MRDAFQRRYAHEDQHPMICHPERSEAESRDLKS